MMMAFLFFFCLDVHVGDKKVSEILGDLIWEEMSDCIIRDCLVHSIPTNSSHLAEYSEVRLKRAHRKICQTVEKSLQYNI